MFHEITDAELGRRRKTRLVVLVVVVVACVLIGFGYSAVRANARAQGAKALRDSILASARQCCAIEGSYPSSLEYLESHYGLTINHNDYVISYECFAGNVVPSVVVSPK